VLESKTAVATAILLLSALILKEQLSTNRRDYGGFLSRCVFGIGFQPARAVSFHMRNIYEKLQVHFKAEGGEGIASRSGTKAA
jgi:hypothetical protein